MQRAKMEEGMWSDKLFDFLNEIEPLGTFATYGNSSSNSTSTDHTGIQWPHFVPRVTVHGVGELGWPLMDVAVEPLKAVAARAPFGRGAETLYDESVRKAWQIDADKIELGGGAAWDDLLSGLVLQTCHDLGISSERLERLAVKAHLYKLLLYKAGGHFTPHRDTEKESGMFGTLILQLPSRFTGGSLTVNHGHESKTFQLAHGCDHQYQYIAFYADCQHQLHPVTSGVRICLVFNLVATQANYAFSPSMSHASNNIATESKLQQFVYDWMTDRESSDSGSPKRLGYPLTHQYTPASFGPGSLKGRDDLVFQT